MDIVYEILGIFIVLLFASLMVFIRWSFLNKLRKDKIKNKPFYLWVPFGYVIYCYKNV